ncbi:MAG: radical SAM protein [Deltaproteobacteria bacterium]|nr:radical SAM protein [Deltaproteobacteria bacterium]
MKIQLNKAHYPVTALGPGKRIGIWTQGCSIRCPGCVSLDTWEADRSKAMAIDDLIAWCKRVAGGAAEGITISGGEPFDQPKALAKLLDGLHRWRNTLTRPFDILCYSGYRLEKLQKEHAALLAKLDAIICDPFVEALPTVRWWRGSDNQRLIVLSELGQARFGRYVDAAIDEPKRFQVVADGKRVWFVGIPQRGDLDRIESACAERGVELAATSWRA